MIKDKFLKIMEANVKKWMSAKPELNIFGNNISVSPNYISILYKEETEKSQTFLNGFMEDIKEEVDNAGYSVYVMTGDELKGCGAARAARGEIMKNPELLDELIQSELDMAIKGSIQSYLGLIGTDIIYEKDAFVKMPKDPVNKFLGKDTKEIIIEDGTREMIRCFTQDMYKLKFIDEMSVEISTNKISQRFVDNDKRCIREFRQSGNIYLNGKFNHDEGQILNYLENIFFSNKVDQSELEKIMNNFTSSVIEMKKAVTPTSSQYPVIFSGAALGTMIHEALGGHLLSGKYIQNGTSTTFKDRIDTKVIPEFMTVIDNPLLKGASGYYLFDDEGIASKKISLIEKGILKNYLLDRESAKYFGVKSNGHSRMEWVASIDEDGDLISSIPEPRVSNLEIISDNCVSEGNLRDIVNKYCVDNNRECALYIESGSGEVDVQTSEFRMTPSKAYKLYPNGKKQPVHNFMIIGNAYELLNQIVVTGNKYETSSGVCGSDSGGIPTQNKAPSAFIPAVNIQAVDVTKLKEKLILD